MEHTNESLTLYTNPMSRGRIARWMLEEVSVPYNVKILGYADSMKDPAYLAVNPMGKVPTLIHRSETGSRVITECAAICAYLGEAFPEAGMLPSDAETADYYRWLFFAAGPLEQAIIGRSITIKGEVTGDEDLVIQGHVEGSILHSRSLTIGAQGRVRGDIRARPDRPRA